MRRLASRMAPPSHMAPLPFVGRATEHGQLAAAYGDARQRHTRAVFVESIAAQVGSGAMRESIVYELASI